MMRLKFIATQYQEVNLKNILYSCPYLVDNNVRMKVLVGKDAGQQVPGGHSQREYVAVAASHLSPQYLWGLISHSPEHLKGDTPGIGHPQLHDHQHYKTIHCI